MLTPVFSGVHSPPPLLTSLLSVSSSSPTLPPTHTVLVFFLLPPGSTSPEPPQGETWVTLIGRYQLNSGKHMKSGGTSKWTALQQLVTCASSLASSDFSVSSDGELMPLAPSVTSSSDESLPFHYRAISLSLCHLFFPLSPFPYPFFPTLLNGSLRQWLSDTWPPSRDQEEANAFLMRPWPQCDTVKWQESVAGEPLVQGIYHLNPTDPLSLWEREGGNGNRKRLKRRGENYQRFHRCRTKLKPSK